MTDSGKYNVWTQWEDLQVPDGMVALNPKNFPLETSDLSQISFYVAPYMGGRKVLEYTAAMTNLKVLQVPNAGFDDALEFLKPGVILCNARRHHLWIQTQLFQRTFVPRITRRFRRDKLLNQTVRQILNLLANRRIRRHNWLSPIIKRRNVSIRLGVLVRA